MSLLLGIDLGTSYFKVGLFEASGDLKGLGRVPVQKVAPAPGRCELAVGEFWRALRRGLSDALAQARATPGDISALSYSSQASSFVLLDSQDEPLTPFVVWTDARGASEAEELDGFARTADFGAAIGFEGLSAQSAPAKWRWFQRHESATWVRTRRIMTMADYFAFTLTGERVVDASTVAFLGAYHLTRRGWWTEALQRYGVDPERLSAPVTPGTVFGRTIRRATEALGIPAGIPFAAGALDHHAAALGSGLGRFADLSISTGTVLAALVLVDTPTPQAECYHGCHVDGSRFWRLSFDPDGAGQLEDYQRAFAPQRSVETLLALAARVPAGAAWHDSPNRDDGTAVRAVLERVAAAHARLVARVVAGTPMAGNVSRVLATGGGARSPLWLQINADMLGVPVVTPACPERACLGAAAFAAVAAGGYRTLEEATAAMVRPDRVFEPDAALHARYQELLRGRIG